MARAVELAFRLALGRARQRDAEQAVLARIPPQRAAGRVRPGDVQPERVPLCLVMPSCARSRTAVPPARAASSSATPSAASAAWPWPRCCSKSSSAPRTARCATAAGGRISRRRRSRSSSCSWPAARATWRPSIPSRCSTSSTASRGPAEFGEAKYQFVQQRRQAARHAAARSRKHGQSGIEVSDLFPHTAAVHRRHRRHPLLPRRHGRPLGGAVRAVHRPRRAGLSEHGLVGRLRPRLGEPSRCRPTSSCPIRRARWKPASRCTRNGFLPAVYQPTMFRAGDRPGAAISICPQGVIARPAPRDARADPRAERGDARAGRRRVRPRASAPTTWRSRCRPRRRRSSTSRGEPQETLDLYGVGDEPTDDYGRRCLLARRLVEKGVRFVVRRLRRRPGQHAVGRPRATSRRITSAWPPQTDQPIAGAAEGPEAPRPARHARWCCGAASSAARRRRKAARAATITTSASPCGWPAAASRAARSSAPPTPSACSAVEKPYHFRDIHTTILHQLGLDQDELTYPAPGPQRTADARRGEGDPGDRVTRGDLATGAVVRYLQVCRADVVKAPGDNPGRPGVRWLRRPVGPTTRRGGRQPEVPVRAVERTPMDPLRAASASRIALQDPRDDAPMGLVNALNEWSGRLRTNTLNNRG